MLIVTQVSDVESRTFGKFKYNKNIHNQETERVVKCDELPTPVLNNILGAAFNSRYLKALL